MYRVNDQINHYGTATIRQSMKLSPRKIKVLYNTTLFMCFVKWHAKSREKFLHIFTNQNSILLNMNAFFFYLKRFCVAAQQMPLHDMIFINPQFSFQYIYMKTITFNLKQKKPCYFKQIPICFKCILKCVKIC